MNNLIEGKDFYYNEDGYVVFTEQYHLDKGSCCGNGCRHCPYDHENVPGQNKKESINSEGKLLNAAFKKL
jgi:hypothetical protein